MRSKKLFIAICVASTLLVCIFFIEFNVCKLAYYKNKNDAEEILKIAYSMMDNNSDNGKLSKLLHEKFVSRVQEKNKVVGVLLIPKIDVEAPIRDGTTQEDMKATVGHFIESDYWDGNVSLASHNSGINAHYFEKLNLLNVNDEIQYITKFGIKKYKVQIIKKIESTDWSMVVKNNGQLQNTITLITCINGQPNYRLCVRGIEV